MKINKHIVFLGAGKMGEALISYFVKSGIVAASKVTAVDADWKKTAVLAKRYGIKSTPDKSRALRNADIVFLAVKPQQMPGLLDEIKSLVNKKMLVISIAAGITTRYIEDRLSGRCAVIRTMPNTPAMIGLGATGISKGRRVSKSQIETAKKLFDKAGKTAVLAEDKLDSVTAVSGSGPAYVFFLAEMLERGAVELGLSKETASEFARQTVAGAGRMLEQFSDKPAAELRKNVTSPGGTTEAAITYLEKNNFYDIFIKALKRAKERAQELSK
jgi:pyrroline-5-carboxylate reductase